MIFSSQEKYLLFFINYLTCTFNGPDYNSESTENSEYLQFRFVCISLDDLAIIVQQKCLQNKVMKVNNVLQEQVFPGWLSDW